MEFGAPGVVAVLNAESTAVVDVKLVVPPALVPAPLAMTIPPLPSDGKQAWVVL